MLGLTCVPEKGYNFLYPYKCHFRYAQGRRLLLLCWLLVMLISDSGKRLKSPNRLTPQRLKYWALSIVDLSLISRHTLT